MGRTKRKGTVPGDRRRTWRSGRVIGQTDPGGPRMLEGNPERPMDAPPSPHPDHPVVIALGVGLPLAAAAGTQYVAWCLGFRSTLGAPLLVLSAHATRVLQAVG